MEKVINERIERIVNNEVLVCQSSLVEKLLQAEIISYDDIENIYIDNSEEIEQIQNEIEDSEEYQTVEIEETEESKARVEEIGKQMEELKSRIEELEQEQEEPQEIFEWWIVSDWLAEKLKKFNEPILDSEYGTWWGRTCSGQSIKLDYIMQQIAESIL